MDSSERQTLIIRIATIGIMLTLIVGIGFVWTNVATNLASAPTVEPSPVPQHPAHQLPTAPPINWSVLLRRAGIGLAVILLSCGILTLIVRLLSKLKEKREEQEKQLNDFLSSTHRTFAERELEELKQKYEDNTVQAEVYTDKSKEQQVISLDIHIKDGKITSIEETDNKDRELNDAFKGMTI